MLGRWGQAGSGTCCGGRGCFRGAPSPYPFQHLLQVVSELHKQVDLPAGVAVHRVDLGKRTETREAGQTPSRCGVGRCLRPEGGEGRPAQPPLEHRGVSSPNQGPQTPAQLPWGHHPVGWRMWADTGRQAGSREAHPAPPAVDRTGGSSPGGRGYVDTHLLPGWPCYQPGSLDSNQRKLLRVQMKNSGKALAGLLLQH